MMDVWNKAVLYHFLHAIALFVLDLFLVIVAGPSEAGVERGQPG